MHEELKDGENILTSPCPLFVDPQYLVILEPHQICCAQCVCNAERNNMYPESLNAARVPSSHLVVTDLQAARFKCAFSFPATRGRYGTRGHSPH